MKSFTLSSLIPAFMLFLSLVASASIKRGDYSKTDYTTNCTSGFERCYEVLGMAEACGLESDAQGYSTGVTDETFLKCFCSANGFKSATTTCSDALPDEYRTEFNSLIKWCDQIGHYKRSPLDVPGSFAGLPKPPK